MRQQKGMSDNKLCQVNSVRIWLRVIRIAELADPDGACISPEKFSGNWRDDSTLAWTNQPLPTKKLFKTFYHYVWKDFCSNVKRHIRKERLTLDRRLGSWHRQRRHSRNEWYRTHKWIYNVTPTADGGETVTRFRQ